MACPFERWGYFAARLQFATREHVRKEYTALCHGLSAAKIHAEYFGPWKSMEGVLWFWHLRLCESNLCEILFQKHGIMLWCGLVVWKIRSWMWRSWLYPGLVQRSPQLITLPLREVVSRGRLRTEVVTDGSAGKASATALDCSALLPNCIINSYGSNLGGVCEHAVNHIQ